MSVLTGVPPIKYNSAMKMFHIAAAPGQLPVVTFEQSDATRVRLRIWKDFEDELPLAETSDNEAPFKFDLNNLSDYAGKPITFQSGRVYLEFVPSNGKIYLGPDRQVMSVLVDPQLQTVPPVNPPVPVRPTGFVKGLNITNEGCMSWDLNQVIETDAGKVTFVQWLIAAGIKEIRVWFDDTLRAMPDEKPAFWARLKALQFIIPDLRVVVCLSSEKWAGLTAPTEDSAKSSADQKVRLAKTAGLNPTRTDFEIVNEPEDNGSSNYWPFGFALLRKCVNAMAKVFHAAGFGVIGPSCTGDANGSKTARLYQDPDTKEQLDVDAVANHPYRESTNGLSVLMGGLDKVCPDLGLNLTEAAPWKGRRVLGWFWNHFPALRSTINTTKLDRNPSTKAVLEIDPKDAVAEEKSQIAYLRERSKYRRITYNRYTDVRQFQTSSGSMGLFEVTKASKKITSIKTTIFGEAYAKL